jgi:hypothetical protein
MYMYDRANVAKALSFNVLRYGVAYFWKCRCLCIVGQDVIVFQLKTYVYA